MAGMVLAGMAVMVVTVTVVTAEKGGTVAKVLVVKAVMAVILKQKIFFQDVHG